MDALSAGAILVAGTSSRDTRSEVYMLIVCMYGIGRVREGALPIKAHVDDRNTTFFLSFGNVSKVPEQFSADNRDDFCRQASSQVSQFASNPLDAHVQLRCSGASRSRGHSPQMPSMGNCQDVPIRHEMGLVEPHKVDRRKGMMRGGAAFLHSSTATVPSSTFSTIGPDSEQFTHADERDEECVPEQTSLTVPSFPKPRLSTETSLRLIVDKEEEVGGIRYQFACLEDALMEARTSQKPVLCIEVHIPGNVTIGREVLSHPLIVEAAETLFVPVQCRQANVSINVAGQIPYTTVRLLDDSGVDLVKPIKGKRISVASVASAMIEAMNACDLTVRVPTYLTLLNEEHSGRRWEGPTNCLHRTDRQAVFGMTCPRQGEVMFARLNGVLSTRAGYYQGNHVVQVTYDTTRLSYCSLVQHVLQAYPMATIFYTSNEERIVGVIQRQRHNAVRADIAEFQETIMNKSVDPKHFLRTTMLRFVPLTDLQSTRANMHVSLGAFNEAMHLLSPRQGQILMRAIQNPNKRKEVVDVPIISAWRSISNPYPVQPTQ